MIHLHNAAEGANGPIVANLTPSLRNNRARLQITSANVVGPLASKSNPVLALLNEIAAGRIYVNVHTAANPAGELRGQVVIP